MSKIHFQNRDQNMWNIWDKGIHRHKQHKQEENDVNWCDRGKQVPGTQLYWTHAECRNFVNDGILSNSCEQECDIFYLSAAI